MSGSLATIAADCISELLQYLNGDEFISLMMTGNSLLRHKLRLSCASLSFLDKPSTLFPFAALNLHNLRSLTMHGIKEAPSCLDFRQRRKLALSVGHKTLEKIELGFRNAFSLFLSPNSSFLRLTVKDRFPSLTSLTIHNFVSREPIESLFGEFPQNLTTLSFKTDRHISGSDLDISSIAKLPRHLKSLTLTDFRINDPDSEDFDFFSLFPPNLHHLELSAIEKPTILDYLPSTLLSMRIIADLEVADFVWKASKIPSGLISLELDMLDWELDWDVPLPSTLERIDFYEALRGNHSITFDSIPTGIKTIDRNIIGDDSHGSLLHSIFKRFPHLENTSISSESDVACLPERLKILACQTPLQIRSPLPSSLTKMVIYFPLSSNCFEYLPLTLRTLNVGPMRNASREFPPWNAADIAKLASKVRLETFMVRLSSFESVYSLSPLSNMKTLKNFILTHIGLESLLSSPNWLPHCLPRYLKVLDLSYSKFTDTTSRYKDSEEKFSDDFLSLCNFREVTPHLKSLKMQADFSSTIKFGPSFATLPLGLVLLEISFLSAELETDAASKLPRTLKSLYLRMRTHMRNKISNAHLEALPETLQQLDVDFGLSDAFDEKVFEILPRSICALDGFASRTSEYKSMATATLNFLDANLRRVGPQAEDA